MRTIIILAVLIVLIRTVQAQAPWQHHAAQPPPATGQWPPTLSQPPAIEMPVWFPEWTAQAQAEWLEQTLRRLKYQGDVDFQLYKLMTTPDKQEK